MSFLIIWAKEYVEYISRKFDRAQNKTIKSHKFMFICQTEENQQSAYYNTANTLNWSASTISSDTRNSFIGTGAIYLQVKDSKGNVGTFTIPGITITNN